MNSCVRMRTERLGIKLIGAKMNLTLKQLLLAFEGCEIRIRRLPDKLSNDEVILE